VLEGGVQQLECAAVYSLEFFPSPGGGVGAGDWSRRKGTEGREILARTALSVALKRAGFYRIPLSLWTEPAKSHCFSSKCLLD
jgi:hypothetical protein